MTAHRHLMTSVLTLAVVLAASVAPTASADPPPLAQAEAAIAANSRAGTAVRPCSKAQTLTAATYPAEPPSHDRVITRGDGFDWGDAAIGAVGAVVLSIFAIATVMPGSRLRPGHSKTAPAS